MDGFLNEEKPNNSNNNANPPITLFGNHLWPKDQQQVIADELNVILESDEISWRPQGADPVPYIEGWRAVEKANLVFGFNGWSDNIIALQADYIDFDKTKQKWQCGCFAIVKITLRDGSSREDVGFGHDENARKGQAIEKAKKEAVTDARKRALRQFGNQLGNCLYDKKAMKGVRTKKSGTVAAGTTTAATTTTTTTANTNTTTTTNTTALTTTVQPQQSSGTFSATKSTTTTNNFSPAKPNNINTNQFQTFKTDQPTFKTEPQSQTSFQPNLNNNNTFQSQQPNSFQPQQQGSFQPQPQPQQQQQFQNSNNINTFQSNNIHQPFDTQSFDTQTFQDNNQQQQQQQQPDMSFQTTTTTAVDNNNFQHQNQSFDIDKSNTANMFSNNSNISNISNSVNSNQFNNSAPISKSPITNTNTFSPSRPINNVGVMKMAGGSPSSSPQQQQQNVNNNNNHNANSNNVQPQFKPFNNNTTMGNSTSTTIPTNTTFQNTMNKFPKSESNASDVSIHGGSPGTEQQQQQQQQQQFGGNASTTNSLVSPSAPSLISYRTNNSFSSTSISNSNSTSFVGLGSNNSTNNVTNMNPLKRPLEDVPSIPFFPLSSSDYKKPRIADTPV